MSAKLDRYISVFAHFDPDNLVDDYVLHYLKELKKISDKIVFVSDCDLPAVEIAKVAEICFCVIAKRHGEYDFGSYKRGIAFLQKNKILADFDHLIIANDSCYGPLKPLLPIFSEMQKKRFDFWGMTTNKEGYAEHLQSYFVVFNKKVFSSAEFTDFFAAVQKEKNKMKVVERCEIRLTTVLVAAGFSSGAFAQGPVLGWDKVLNLLKNDFPFIKVLAVKAVPNPKILREKFLKLIPLNLANFLKIPDINWTKFVEKNQLKLIENHLSRVGVQEEIRVKFFHEKFLFFLIKNGVFRIKFFGISVAKKSVK